MLTPYQKRQKDEDLMFDDVDERRKRKTKGVDRKRTEEVKKKNVFKTNVSSQNHRNKKRRGRHGRLVSHFTLPFLSGPCVFSRQAGPAAFFHGRTQNSGKLPLTTENVLLTNETKRET